MKHATTAPLCLFVLLLASPHTLAETTTWPQWLGPDRDGLSDQSGLLQEWPEGGPERIWLSDKCGLGYSGPAVVGDKLYIMGATEGKARLFAYDTTSGDQLWSVEIGEMHEHDWGAGPEGTPTVDGDRIYALSGNGVLLCASTAGDEIWRVSLVDDLGGKKPFWGYSESPLVDGDQVLCTPGGDQGAFAALDKATGEVRWRTPNITDECHYASIVIAEPNGQKQYVQLLPNRLVGLAPGDGTLLWELQWPGRVAVIPTPIDKGNQVYITSGYGVGCQLVEISPENKVTPLFGDNPSNVMVNHHGGVVWLGDYLYGYSDGKGWVCQNAKTGEMEWRERSDLDKGAASYADGRLYCLTEKEGIVALLEPNADEYREKGRFTLSPLSEQRKPSGAIWTHPVIIGGKMYLRDQEYLSCYDVSAD